MPPKNERLTYYWDKPVSHLATLNRPAQSPAEKERHTLYALGLMAITHKYWNGNKYGTHGQYPWNAPIDHSTEMYHNEDYRGHNIAAFAVDADGRIIDFEFNHNALFNSSAEHAESRLVRRIFQLSQVHDSWHFSQTPSPKSDYTTFADVTIYTTLESCSQCSGVMALARVRQIVYLQEDPGMYMIGNILRNLTEATKLEAPLPIAGNEFDFIYFHRLNEAFDEFPAQLRQKPFYQPFGNSKKPNAEPSITSFLCTGISKAIFNDAEAELASLTVDKLYHPMHKPTSREGVLISSALTNAECLSEIRSFFEYAIQSGRRGTPHR